MTKVIARAPGAVTIIGDHTESTGGLAVAMAIDLESVIELDRGGDWLELVSADEEEPAVVFFDDPREAFTLHPPWARYLAGVIQALRPDQGGRGFLRSEIPLGIGLGSSAALTVATALALGFDGRPSDLALLCQRAEAMALASPAGIVDPLASAGGIDGHLLLIDCDSLEIAPVQMSDVEIWIVDSGSRRHPTTDFSGVRRAQCEDAETLIGPLRTATLDEVATIAIEDLRRRARHVVSENQRVKSFADALVSRDYAEAGRLMVESHASSRDDFEASTSAVDDLVEHVCAVPGVHGARLAGAGFGGLVVVLAAPGAQPPAGAQRLVPSAGASWRNLE